jgi:hypothetical protein
MMRRVTYREYHYGDGPDAGAATVELLQPQRAPAVSSDVAVPLLQALASGVFGGLGLTAGLVLLGKGAHWWPTWGIAILACVAAAWFWRLRSCEESLYRVETILQPVAPSEPPERSHILALNPYQGRQAQVVDDRAALRGQFARFVMGASVSTSARRWEKMLGREKYQSWRDLLISSGYARWKSERDQRAGWILTAPAVAIIGNLQDQAAAVADDHLDQAPMLRLAR